MDRTHESKSGTARNIPSRVDLDRVARTPHISIFPILLFFRHTSWQWRIRVMSAAVSGTCPLVWPSRTGSQTQALGESTEHACVEPRDVAVATQVLPGVYGISSPMPTMCSSSMSSIALTESCPQHVHASDDKLAVDTYIYIHIYIRRAT